MFLKAAFSLKWDSSNTQPFFSHINTPEVNVNVLNIFVISVALCLYNVHKVVIARC